jgi:hypothetical protein
LISGLQGLITEAEGVIYDDFRLCSYFGYAGLKKEIENLDIPFVKYTVETDANGARIKVDGPWAGFRSGLSLGYRF